jgi:sulfhydrogenase subunit alpha
MPKTVHLDIHHITRVEGHGNIRVAVEDGKLREVSFDIVEAPRYFEAMLLGKEITSAYEITARICGICSISHSVASLNAIESILGVQPTPQTKLIRELAFCSEVLTSHLLHICFLAAPDFLGVPSVIPLLDTDPELVVKAIQLKRAANIIAEKICGRHTHPISLVVGGLTFVPGRAALLELKRLIAESILPDLDWLLQRFAKIQLPIFSRETEYICLENFYREPAGGQVFLSSDSGAFPITDYRKKLVEYVLPTSTAKMVRAGRDSYMVGALARFNNCYTDLKPQAKAAASRLDLAPPCHNPFAITTAQLVECVHFAVKAQEYVETLLKTEPQLETPPQPIMRAGTGIGVVEAPRGALIHEYTTDAAGIITGANCIIPTGQNCANITADMRAYLPSLLDREKHEIAKAMEMLVRAYDPCISCSAHFVELEWS